MEGGRGERGRGGGGKVEACQWEGEESNSGRESKR